MVVGILGVAAAAAAMWNRYAPPNACLFCAAPEHYETALKATPDAVGIAGAADGHSRGQYGAANSSSAIPGVSDDASGANATGSRHGDSRRLWTPWANGADAHRYGSSNPRAPSVSMGGLWRLMTLAHRAPDPVAEAAAPKTARTSQPAAHSAPRPPRAGAPAPRAPAAPPIVPPVPPVATVVTPTNPFTGFVTGSDPFQPPPPPGSLDPGGPGGNGPSGSGPSATPEPASLLLIGTGLLVLAGELRRRRVI
jgi:hypothetical protein